MHPFHDLRLAAACAAAALALAGLRAPGAAAVEPGAPPASGAGARLYATYCASCHGPTGRGDGPVAPALTTPPPDLTQLWRHFGSPLAADEVAMAIDGRRDVAAHGPREMPVWGEKLFAGAPPTTPGLEGVRGSLIAALVRHLGTLQAEPPEAE